MDISESQITAFGSAGTRGFPAPVAANRAPSEEGPEMVQVSMVGFGQHLVQKIRTGPPDLFTPLRTLKINP